MRRITTTANSPEARSLVGALVAVDARHPERPGEVVMRKGRTLTDADLDRLAGDGPVPLVLLIPEGELDENTAAARIAAALVGPGSEVGSDHQGMVVLRSARRGFFRVNHGVLTAVNEQPGVLAFSTIDERPTDAGVALASVKVAPLLLSEEIVRRVEAICAERGPVVTVAEVPARRVALVGTTRLSATARRRAEESVSERVGWYGSTLTADWARPSHDTLMAAFERAHLEAELVLVATAATLDPQDAVFEALRGAGGTVERIGVPIEPGTACWVGRLGTLTVFGLASCELFGSPGAFDVLLPRLLMGEHADTPLLSSLARGGLLLEGPPLVPEYVSAEREPASATSA